LYKTVKISKKFGCAPVGGKSFEMFMGETLKYWAVG
jgi:hypothetical protein